ncbi:hypothetical protein ACNCTE_003248 [Escherichia coli]
MITPQDAEKRTREIVAEYISECGCENPRHIRLVLTKLISMAAQAIVATNGKEAALQVLEHTFVHTAQHEVPYRMGTTAEGGLYITVSRKH